MTTSLSVCNLCNNNYDKIITHGNYGNMYNYWNTLYGDVCSYGSIFVIPLAWIFNIKITGLFIGYSGMCGI